MVGAETGEDRDAGFEMGADGRPIPLAQGHSREAEFGGAEADQVVIGDEPAPALLRRLPSCGRVPGPRQQHRQAAERDPVAAAIADLLAQGQAAAKQLAAALAVTARALQVAEGVQRGGFALPVSEALEAGQALLGQLAGARQVALDARHRGKVDEDVGRGGLGADAAGDEDRVLLQQERIAEFGLG